MVNMNKTIVIINGVAQSGKDTFIGYCSKYTNVTNISSIDVLNQCARLLGWNGDKTNEYRAFMSHFKQLANEFNNHSFEYCKQAIENHNEGILFLHIREPKEILKLKELYPEIITMLVCRDVSIPNNDSDKGVNLLDYQYVVFNNSSLEHLEWEAHAFICGLYY